MRNNILKIFFLSVFVFGGMFSLTAQVGQGAIKGKVTDKETGETIPFATIAVKSKGNIVTGAQTDFDGKFNIKPLQPGVYDLEASFVGYQTIVISGVLIKSDKTTFQDFKLSIQTEVLEAVEVISYTVPLIDKDNTVAGETVTREDIQNLPGRGATDVAKTVGGVYSKDDGSNELNARGARSDANFVYIDGVKVRAGSSLPKAALEQVSVITGGVPAQYGDVTGAVVSITTRGAAREYSGGIDYLTSGYKVDDGKVVGMDAMGYNLLEFNATGPLIWKKDTAGNKKDPILGFFLAGNVSHIVDPSPSIIGTWKVKDDVRDWLFDNPLRFNPDGGGTFLNEEFLRQNDFEKTRTRLNVERQALNLNAKLDFNISKNTTLTFGGAADVNDRNDDFYRDRQNSVFGSYSYSLFNAHHNPNVNNQTYRGYARLTQRFGSSADTSRASKIKNAYYSIQADYQITSTRLQDENLKDNLFGYGYYGKFRTYQSRDYDGGQDSLTGVFGLIQTTFVDTLVTYEPDYNYNANGASITQGFYNLFGFGGFDGDGNPIVDPILAGENLRNLNNISLAGGLRNGDAPRDIYGMWRSPALVYNEYALRNREQYRLNAIGSADIGDHSITLGFEYEQRVDRNFSVAPRGLWTIGRQLTNRHIANLDFSNPNIIQTGTFPIVEYERLNGAPGEYSGDDPQSFFDFNLRNKLGLNPDGVDYVDFDSYDPTMYALDMFSADELLNNGNNLVTYYGYDHTGKRVNSYNTGWLNDFFNAKDQYGNFTRPIAPFQPIYVAGFIQDKFSFDDLVFNVGVRVDRYDANQKVLIDPYVMFPTVRAGEDLSQHGLSGVEVPGNVGDDYVVYVDNVSNPTEVKGYRDGDIWYNAQGLEIQDASVLETSSGSVAPLLVDKDVKSGQEIRENSFRDYKPRTAVMPRISFSFPISDEALFFAHYDVLTKRPTTGIGGSGTRLDPIDYFFINSIGNNVVNNPDLGLEQTIDYAVGFKQKLNNFSSLSIETFYREFRDLVQVINLAQAYPNGYITYVNRDFGTVKGLTVSYDLRRMGNIRGRVAYTMQFAEGTGSSATGGLGLARAGKPNLRNLIPLSFDQRHTLIANIDYRYGQGKDYNGPEGFMRHIFENFGANAVINVGSGTPYSGQKNVTQTGLFSGNAALLDGQLNGARLPWNFSLNLGLDKGFMIGKTEEKKGVPLTLYFQIENLLNTLNIANVYRVTGNPDDDGFLTAEEYQNFIASQNSEQSFRELYGFKVNRGSNFTLPRRVKLGIRIDF